VTDGQTDRTGSSNSAVQRPALKRSAIRTVLPLHGLSACRHVVFDI